MEINKKSDNEYKTPRGRELYEKYKIFLSVLTFIYKLFPIKIRKIAFEFHRNTIGKIGIGLRYAILKSICNNVGDNVAIFTGVYLLHPENLNIGNNVSIHPMCYIECLGGVFIGNDVSIAHGVTIMSITHTYNNTNIKIRDQNSIALPVYIKEDVWIGAKATILCGVIVESGSIVGANAVVTKDVLEKNIVAGVPAKQIKVR